MAIKADQATITGMVNAFQVCEGECTAIDRNVVGSAEHLVTVWKSDQAAPTYLGAVEEWLTGFKRIQASLQGLHGNMQSWSNLTTTTEDANTGTAGGWAVVPR